MLDDQTIQLGEQNSIEFPIISTKRNGSDFLKYHVCIRTWLFYRINIEKISNPDVKYSQNDSLKYSQCDNTKYYCHYLRVMKYSTTGRQTLL